MTHDAGPKVKVYTFGLSVGKCYCMGLTFMMRASRDREGRELSTIQTSARHLSYIDKE